MEERYYKEYSHNLGRDMEYKVIGHAGKPAFFFAPQNGRFWDVESYGMVDLVADYIRDGRLQVVLVDSIDQESWDCKWLDGRSRSVNCEKWFKYVTEELLPTIYSRNPYQGKALTFGCSMGGFHAGNVFFRRPDLFDTMISLSGMFNAEYFFNGYMDELVYANSPAHFLRNMPSDHPYMALYNQSNIIACVGQGAWENETLDGTRELDWICNEKGIRHWCDFWGFDVNHDWPWWKVQMPYFFSKIGL